MKKKDQKFKNLINKNYKYQLLENGFSNKDISIGKKVLMSKRITMASHTKNFETAFAKKLGVTILCLSEKSFICSALSWPLS